jgi:hypothetical protein
MRCLPASDLDAFVAAYGITQIRQNTCRVAVITGSAMLHQRVCFFSHACIEFVVELPNRIVWLCQKRS